MNFLACVFTINQLFGRYEKMISGMYMGEIARRVIVKLVEENCLFEGKSSEKLMTPMEFFTKYISEIERLDVYSSYCGDSLLFATNA